MVPSFPCWLGLNRAAGARLGRIGLTDISISPVGSGGDAGGGERAAKWELAKNCVTANERGFRDPLGPPRVVGSALPELPRSTTTRTTRFLGTEKTGFLCAGLSEDVGLRALEPDTKVSAGNSTSTLSLQRLCSVSDVSRWLARR